MVPSLTDPRPSEPEARSIELASVEPGFEGRWKSALGSESIAAWAARLGVERSYLYRILRGERIPSLAIMWTVCTHSEMSLEWLLSGQGMPSRELATRTLVVPYLDITPDGKFVATGERDVVNAKKAGGMNVQHAGYVVAPDDGLEPRVMRGDGLLIEAPASALVDGGVYLVRSGGEILIRRAAITTTGQWVMLQENPVGRARPALGASLEELGVVARVWSILERAL